MEEGESDFQSYHIIKLTCPGLHNHKTYKETGKYSPFKGRKRIQQNLSLNGSCIRQRL